MGYGEDGTGDKGTALTGPGKGWGRTGNRSDPEARRQKPYKVFVTDGFSLLCVAKNMRPGAGWRGGRSVLLTWSGVSTPSMEVITEECQMGKIRGAATPKERLRSLTMRLVFDGMPPKHTDENSAFARIQKYLPIKCIQRKDHRHHDDIKIHRSPQQVTECSNPRFCRNVGMSHSIENLQIMAWLPIIHS